MTSRQSLSLDSRRLLRMTTLVCAAATASAVAQQTNTSSAGADDDAIELSPFQVDASNDSGY